MEKGICHNDKSLKLKLLLKGKQAIVEHSIKISLTQAMRLKSLLVKFHLRCEQGPKVKKIIINYKIENYVQVETSYD